MDNKETLLEFPCEFQIKVIGTNNAQFIQDVIRITQKYFPDLEDTSVHVQPSREQAYTALRLTVYAHDKATLDALYIELNQHAETKMVL